MGERAYASYDGPCRLRAARDNGVPARRALERRVERGCTGTAQACAAPAAREDLWVPDVGALPRAWLDAGGRGVGQTPERLLLDPEWDGEVSLRIGSRACMGRLGRAMDGVAWRRGVVVGGSGGHRSARAHGSVFPIGP